MQFKVGDYVRLKEGTSLETGEPASHWAGQIKTIYPEEQTCLIELDAPTLDSLDDAYILDCIEEGSEPFEYIFDLDDLLQADRRDSDEAMKAAVARIEEKLMALDEDYEPEFDESIFEEWIEDFYDSSFFQSLNDYQQDYAGFIAHTFLDYLYSYEYVTPDSCKPHHVEEVCLNIVPRKVTAEIELFENFGIVLVQFLKFLEAEGHIPESRELQKTVLRIQRQIPKLAGDPNNWGMAKSMMMGAQAAGYDIESQEDIAAYIEQMNRQQLLPGALHNINKQNLTPAKEDPYKHIGRNEKISVRYEDGTVKKNIKFKVVERDLREGRCVLVG